MRRTSSGCDRHYPTHVGNRTIVGELAGKPGRNPPDARRADRLGGWTPGSRERDLDEISVADIAERAGVNRSSFYQHYSDKDTLLADAIDAVVEEAGTSIPVMSEITEQPPAILIEYLRHVEQNAAVYARIFGEHGSPVVLARLRDRVQRIVIDAVATSHQDVFSDVPPDVLAAGLSGSVLGVLEAWLTRDPRPPVETAVHWLWSVLLGPQAFDRPAR